MTRFGLVSLLFFFAVFLAFLSSFFSFGEKRVVVREESPKVSLRFPLDLEKFREELVRGKIVYDILKVAGGWYEKGAIYVENFESAEVESLRIDPEVEVLEVFGEKIIRFPGMGLVVIGR